MPNPFLHLLDTRGLASEDATTGALCELLNRDCALLEWFVEFLFDSDVPAPVRSASGQLRVLPQFEFSGAGVASPQSLGRIDAVILSPDRTWMIGIEFKVRDREKPARLKNYRIVMDAEFSGPNYLFEVVQRREHEISPNIVNGIRVWNDLAESGKRWLGRNANSPAAADFQQYLEFLKVSQTVLGAGRPLKRTATSMSDSPGDEECRSFWEKLMPRLPDGLEAQIESDKNVPPQLRLGRCSWTAKFGGMTWVERVYLNLRLDPATGSRFVLFQIIFHSANFSKFDYPARMLPEWAAAANRAGLRVWQGPPSGWDARKRIELHHPWKLTGNPKYFYAEEDIGETASAGAQLGSEEALAEEALRRLEAYLRLVDGFAA